MPTYYLRRPALAAALLKRARAIHATKPAHTTALLFILSLLPWYTKIPCRLLLPPLCLLISVSAAASLQITSPSHSPAAPQQQCY